MPNEMDSPGSEKQVVIGVITRARGIRGEVNVKPLTDFPGRFNDLDHITLEMTDGSVGEYKLERSRFVNGTVIIKISGVDDRNVAESLKGSYLCVPLTETVPLEEDTYYIFDLEGMDVCDLEGNRIGNILRVEQYPANDVLVIDTTASEIMIPAVKHYVLDVDKAGNRIVVDLPDDLVASSAEVRK